MTDLLQRLTEARPTDTELDRMWTPADRRARLETVLTADRARRPHHGRRVALLAAAATVAAAALVPAVLDSGDAAAADLRALALSAAAYDGPVLAEGSWLHERSTSLQVNRAPYEGGSTYQHEYESWTRWDGRYLLIDRSASAGGTSYDVIDGSSAIERVDDPHDYSEPASYQDPTPAFAATLPDDADGLLAYLDGRVFGSSSHQEALYEALTQLAASHTLPPTTLAATFEALSQVEDVTTEDVSVQGRPAVEIRFTEDLTSSTETIVVDRGTGQVLSTRSRSKQSDFTSTTTLSETVSEVPADVLDAFRTHEEGVRYDDAGVPIAGS